jgi:carboxyl-terminal processing protease
MIKKQLLKLTTSFLLVSSIVSNIAFASPENSPTTEAKTKPAAPQSLPLDELRSFSEVFYYVKSAYVEEVDDRALIQAAISGMVNSLDNHSRYLGPSAFANFTTDNNGEYAGIGLSFDDHKNGIQIDSIVKGGPADRQNLSKGMVVSKINGIDIKQISPEDAYKLLHGKVNSQVRLTVLNDPLNPKSENNSADFSLIREVIQLPSITSDLLDSNIGYLAISQFTKKSPYEFVEAVGEMSNSRPLEKLIIDLRNNPGGVMESAVEISDLFINSGTLLTSSGRAEDANETFTASSITPFSEIELVVMMNENSASSSEILAAALQDHERATILGDKSYGKGSIQSIYFLRQDSGLKITTAKYFSPNGKKIHGVGIIPDVKFKTAGLENKKKSKLLDDLELLQAFKLISNDKE